ncbi:peptidase S8/S53 domain-containing protein [Syncephalis pseudoplumigaleata]|uniref:Peptidase S8/S53 domain-containing protein n=1 Tax=Syncephalis pseudoplumigaleata TaxID=1712513 RepID=A0A4P9YXJ5_9FUNG|nr:peptidase S8/S53 domain-containing protein [Syncephalis pseudoplumigaleata]|eukprot:RKP24638.1 peptidase S8/S53 domain-containing protein [Syncephalis pseudoplumigaleata]
MIAGVHAGWPNEKPRTFLQRGRTIAHARTGKEATNLAHYHQATGVAALHAAGITGAGVHIVLISDGARANHPAFAHQIQGNYNFHESADHTTLLRGREGSKELLHNRMGDREMFVHSTGYATGMAGIIASRTRNYLGVAPDAQLSVCNVFGGKKTTSIATVMKALEKAVEIKADVVVLPEIAHGVEEMNAELRAAITDAADQGIVMLRAATFRNLGGDGYFPYIGLPVIAVGGYVQPYAQARWFEEEGTDKRIAFKFVCDETSYNFEAKSIVPVSVINQGAGALQVQKACYHTTSARPSSIDLDIMQSGESTTRTIHFAGTSDARHFTFFHIPTSYLLVSGTVMRPLPVDNPIATSMATFSSVVPSAAFGSGQVNVTIGVSANLASGDLLHYSGFIVVNPNDGPDRASSLRNAVHITYAGLIGAHGTALQTWSTMPSPQMQLP